MKILFVKLTDNVDDSLAFRFNQSGDTTDIVLSGSLESRVQIVVGKCAKTDFDVIVIAEALTPHIVVSQMEKIISRLRSEGSQLPILALSNNFTSFLGDQTLISQINGALPLQLRADGVFTTNFPLLEVNVRGLSSLAESITSSAKAAKSEILPRSDDVLQRRYDEVAQEQYFKAQEENELLKARVRDLLLQVESISGVHVAEHQVLQRAYDALEVRSRQRERESAAQAAEHEELQRRYSELEEHSRQLGEEAASRVVAHENLQSAYVASQDRGRQLEAEATAQAAASAILRSRYEVAEDLCRRVQAENVLLDAKVGGLLLQADSAAAAHTAGHQVLQRENEALEARSRRLEQEAVTQAAELANLQRKHTDSQEHGRQLEEAAASHAIEHEDLQRAFVASQDRVRQLETGATSQALAFAGLQKESELLQRSYQDLEGLCRRLQGENALLEANVRALVLQAEGVSAAHASEHEGALKEKDLLKRRCQALEERVSRLQEETVLQSDSLRKDLDLALGGSEGLENTRILPNGEIIVAGQIVEAPPQPQKLLSFFIKNYPHFLSTEDIRTHLFAATTTEPNAVRRAVFRLNKAIRENFVALELSSDFALVTSPGRQGWRIDPQALEQLIMAKHLADYPELARKFEDNKVTRPPEPPSIFLDRIQSQTPDAYCGLIVVSGTRKISFNSNVLDLTPTQEKLMCCLIAAKGEIVTRDALYDSLSYPANCGVSKAVVSNYIRGLQKRVDVALLEPEQEGMQLLIEPVGHRGWRLVEKNGQMLNYQGAQRDGLMAEVSLAGTTRNSFPQPR